jgi:hypothetical protein
MSYGQGSSVIPLKPAVIKINAIIAGVVKTILSVFWRIAHSHIAGCRISRRVLP